MVPRVIAEDVAPVEDRLRDLRVRCNLLSEDEEGTSQSPTTKFGQYRSESRCHGSRAIIYGDLELLGHAILP